MNYIERETREIEGGKTKEADRGICYAVHAKKTDLKRTCPQKNLSPKHYAENRKETQGDTRNGPSKNVQHVDPFP